MKAVVLRAPGDVGVDDVAEPAIMEPGDAIVAVRATAICGADLFPFHGLTPGFEDGTMLGHEFAGEVVERRVGRAGTAVGQRVVNTSMISDGTCPSCRAGRVTQCDGRSLFGYSGVYPRLDGGQAELVRVPHADRACDALPDERLRRGGRLPRRHPPDRLRRGRPRRRAARRHRRRGRLRPGRPDGDPVRGRRGRRA